MQSVPSMGGDALIHDLPTRVRVRLVLSWGVLTLERFTGAFWPLVCLLALALALAVSGALLWLPGWLHGAIVVALGGLFGALLVEGVRRFRPVRRADALAHLDQSLPHYPLATLGDRPSSDDPISQTLWAQHHQQTLASLKRLRVAGPRPIMAQQDPWGLRVVAALAVVLTLPFWDSGAQQRLSHSVSFDWTRGAIHGPDRIALWVTPPDYTGVPPLEQRWSRQDADAVSPLQIPQGSRLVLVAHGTAQATVALGADIYPTTAFSSPQGDGRVSSSRADLILPAGLGRTTLTVRDGGVDVVSWPVQVTADQAPTVAFAGDLRQDSGQGTLHLPYHLADDYGVRDLILEMSRPDQPTRTVPLSLPASAQDQSAAPQGLEGTAVVNLAADRWAGLPVTVRLSVSDAAGAIGLSDPQTVRLPERLFTHPVARKVAAIRRGLIDHPAEGMDERIYAIADLDKQPDAFGGTLSVYLGLRLAALRLAFGPYPEGWPHVAPPDVVDLLWSVAVRIEDGQKGDAEQRMFQAQKALDEAIAAQAGAPEIAQRVDDLRRAVHEYLQALFKDMPDLSAEDLELLQAWDAMQQDQAGSASINPDSIESLLRQLQELEAIGAHEAAQEVRERLSQMLDLLRQARPPDPQMLEALRQGMQKMGALIARQKDLLEQTFQAQRGDAAHRAERAASLEKQQGQLASDLAETLHQAEATIGQPLPAPRDSSRDPLGNPLGGPQSTGADGDSELAQGAIALDSMRFAERALNAGRLNPAVRGQQDALEALRKGAKKMMQQMMQAMGQGQGGPVLLPGGGQQGAGRAGGGDPLGGGPGGYGGGEAKIPDQGATTRARDILLELRRRANDGNRSSAERDYLRRLLDLF